MDTEIYFSLVKRFVLESKDLCARHIHNGVILDGFCVHIS